jgi:hypothetical protein
MKTIKQAFVLLVVIATTAMITNAQSKSDKMYDALSGKEGVTNFSFSKNMIDAIDIDLGDNEEEQNVTGDLHMIRFMSYNPEKGEMSGTEFTKKAIGLLPSNYKKFEDEDEDGDDDVEIWLLGKNKKFQECHVFTLNEGENQMRFVVSFYGEFTVNDLDELKKKGKGFSEEK